MIANLHKSYKPLFYCMLHKAKPVLDTKKEVPDKIRHLILEILIVLPHTPYRDRTGPVLVVTAPHKAGIAADAPAFAKFRLTADG